MAKYTDKDGVIYNNIKTKTQGIGISNILVQTNVQGRTTSEYLDSNDYFNLVSAIDLDWGGVAPGIGEDSATGIYTTGELLTKVKEIHDNAIKTEDLGNHEIYDYTLKDKETEETIASGTFKKIYELDDFSFTGEILTAVPEEMASELVGLIVRYVITEDMLYIDGEPIEHIKVEYELNEQLTSAEPEYNVKEYTDYKVKGAVVEGLQNVSPTNCYTKDEVDDMLDALATNIESSIESTVYSKTEIDNAEQATAAALVDLDNRKADKSEIDFGYTEEIYNYEINSKNFNLEDIENTTITGTFKLTSNIEGRSIAFEILTCSDDTYVGSTYIKFNFSEVAGYEDYEGILMINDNEWAFDKTSNNLLYLKSYTLNTVETQKSEKWLAKDYVDYTVAENINTLGNDMQLSLDALQTAIDDRYTKAETDIFYDHTIFFDLLIPQGISNGLLTVEEFTGEWNHYDQGNDHEHACTSYSELKALVSDAHNAIKFRWFDNSANEILVLTPSFFVLNSGIYFTCVYNFNNETKAFRIVVPNDGTQQPGVKIVYKLYNKPVSVSIDAYTKSESDNKYQPKGNYLTEHQSLEDYATKQYVNAEDNALLEAAATAMNSVMDQRLGVTGISVKAYVDGQITDLVGAAPAELDTLKEIADALANDETAIGAINTAISTKADATSVYTKDEVYNKTESDAKYASKETVDTLIANAPENFDTLKEFADSLADLKVVDVSAKEAIPGEHYTQEEIDAAVEGDEAYGKTTDDWKVEPVPAVEEVSHNMTIGEFVNNATQAVDEKAEIAKLQTKYNALLTLLNLRETDVNNVIINEELENSSNVTFDEPVDNVVIPETTAAYTVTAPLDDNATVTLTSNKYMTLDNTSEEPVSATVQRPAEAGETGTSGTTVYLVGQYDTLTLENVSPNVKSGRDAAQVNNVVISENNTKNLTLNLDLQDGATITNNSATAVTINDKNNEETVLAIVAPNSTVTLNGGNYTTLDAEVSDNTLVIKRNAHIGTLNVTKGNVKVEVARQSDIANVIENLNIAEGYSVDYLHDDITAANISKLTTTGTHTFQEDLTKSGNFSVGLFSNDDMVWDLNGHNLTSSNTRGYGIFTLRGTAQLEINDTVGTGVVKNTADEYGFWTSTVGSKVIINGGNFEAATHVLYAQKGTIEVNGGTFKLTDAATADKDQNGNFKFLLNCHDEDYVSGDAKIIVRGGKFYGFDPSNTYGEPGGPVSYVPEGYESVPTNEVYEYGTVYEVRQKQS